ncbi:MAG: DUF721 domain-containing protein [Nitrospirae bacterium]|nr:DUF721 domain-containing protein [Nitrospirota bacterium]
MDRAESLLAPILKRLGIDEDVRLLRIRKDWPGIFDRPLATHMSPSRLLEGELLLNVASPIWMQQLSFSKNEILDKLRKYGVRDLRLRVGKVSWKKDELKDPEMSRQVELGAEDAEFLDQLISGIHDDELKETIRTVAKKSLSAKRRRTGRH